MALIKGRDEGKKVEIKEGENKRKVAERQKGREGKGQIFQIRNLQGKAIILLWRCTLPNGLSGKPIT